jgi:VanZ family protein
MSRQPSIRGVAWLLLAAFSRIYCENQQRGTEQKNLENFQFGQKRNVFMYFIYFCILFYFLAVLGFELQGLGLARQVLYH